MERGDETQHERSKTVKPVCVSGDCLSGQDGMPGRRFGRVRSTVSVSVEKGNVGDRCGRCGSKPGFEG